MLSGPGHFDLQVLSALSNSDFSKVQLYQISSSDGKMIGVCSHLLRCVVKVGSVEVPLLLRLKCTASEFATSAGSVISLLFSFSMIVFVVVGLLIDLTLRQTSLEEVLAVIVDRKFAQLVLCASRTVLRNLARAFLNVIHRFILPR